MIIYISGGGMSSKGYKKEESGQVKTSESLDMERILQRQEL